MRIPKVIQKLIDSFEKLPGIGPKTAQRLTFYLLHVPQTELDSFSEALVNLKKNTVLCSVCKNVDECDPCSICSDSARDKGTVMVVEQPLDVLALERAGKYKGVYHILHGAINPLENIGPDEIFIKELVKRVASHPLRQSASEASELPVSEIILATNPTMEGEATAMYIKKQLEQQTTDNLPAQAGKQQRVRVTRLGLGLPTGADLEYADETTLTQSIEGRREF